MWVGFSSLRYLNICKSNFISYFSLQYYEPMQFHESTSKKRREKKNYLQLFFFFFGSLTSNWAPVPACKLQKLVFGL